ncbi:MAG TPA: FG-GAP-like repeat-containing protein [Armatimonadota bacterium]|nr:FG-GAP-like repeat-containing protein [Armatimonadota bacterium]
MSGSALPPRFRARSPFAAAAAVAIGGIFFGVGCSHRPPTGVQYQAMVSAFYTGVAAMASLSQGNMAERELMRATRIDPKEPAAWADLGLYSLRSNDFTAAAKYLDRAHRLAPRSSFVEWYIGLLQGQQGQETAAIAADSKAIQLDPSNLYARYTLVQQLAGQQSPSQDQQAQAQYEAILKYDPNNLVAMAELARLAARAHDYGKVRSLVDRIRSRISSLPQNANSDQKQAFASLKTEYSVILSQIKNNDPGLPITLTYYENYMKPIAAFQASQARLVGNVKQAVGVPLDHFLSLPEPSPLAAPADMKLGFAASGAGVSCQWAEALPLSQIGGPSLIAAKGAQIIISGPGAATLAFPIGAAPSAPIVGVSSIDWNHDGLSDLAFAGQGGLRFYQQRPSGGWSDVTAQTSLPAPILKGSYTGVWAADIYMDGSLDLVLGKSSGVPLILRNNENGTWTPARPFSGIDGVRSFAWGLLNAEAAPEFAFIDAKGRLTVFQNDRSGHYLALALPTSVGSLLTMSVADIDNDGVLDLVALTTGGAIERIGGGPHGAPWVVRPITTWTGVTTDGSARLLIADLDNNGALDLIASGSKGTAIWMGDEHGALHPLPLAPQVQKIRIISAAADPSNGLVSLAGVNGQGKSLTLSETNTAPYHWQIIYPRTSSQGDQRNNSFGVGGTIAVRAGLLTQMQPIAGPVVHFGLGLNQEVNVAYIAWPSGTTQDEFDLKRDVVFTANERLTSSCPWLFAWNGRSMQFVTDVLWKSPLGLRINAQQTAPVGSPLDWVLVPGQDLKPRDNEYDMSITAELWETHFFDAVKLMAVDHPAGTRLALDERFSIPQPPLTLHLTGPLIPITRAVDDQGHDVTSVVCAKDGRYLGTFGKGLYQGITRPHYVEVTLAHRVPRSGPIWLECYGWVRPTDSSINVALSHRNDLHPESLSLDVQEPDGRWKIARSGLGFPAGKNKMVLIDLTGLWPDAYRGPRRVRLSTNMEIFWDRIAACVPQPHASLITRTIEPRSAALRYRGFSAIQQDGWSSPEIPNYNHVTGWSPCWKDLAGYYTRYGDVLPLLKKADDRFVIMNAGDELRLRFPALAPPPSGWVRDFVFISDGWEKDGNLNTTFSACVLPLPSQSSKIYTTPPGALENDPVYREHPGDWRVYQTRYVSPDGFRARAWDFPGRREVGAGR